MKFFKKKQVAISVLVLSIFVSSFVGVSKTPMVDPDAGPKLDEKISTSYYKDFVVDEADVLSAKAEKTKKRAAEAKAHKRNVRMGKKK